jgi:hypothetical protein
MMLVAHIMGVPVEESLAAFASGMVPLVVMGLASIASRFRHG